MKNKKLVISVSSIVMIIIVSLVALNLRKITYTKEFSYLPKYKDMKVEKYQPAEKGQFGNAVYRAKEVQYKDFLKSYEKVLKRDGWKITQDKKPEGLEAKKEAHIVRINVVNSKDNIIILIWTK